MMYKRKKTPDHQTVLRSYPAGNAVSQVLSLPCCKRDKSLALRAVVIYLWCLRHHPSLRLIPLGRFPYQIWVSRSQGLPRSIFPVARKATFLWHFQRTWASERALSTPSAKREPHCPGLHQVRTLQASQPGRAWTFLYRQPENRLRQRLPAFPAHLEFVFLLYHTPVRRSTSDSWLHCQIVPLTSL